MSSLRQIILRYLYLGIGEGKYLSKTACIDLEIGLTEEEEDEIVEAWRRDTYAEDPNIAELYIISYNIMMYN
jgi:hypothetical protein